MAAPYTSTKRTAPTIITNVTKATFTGNQAIDKGGAIFTQGDGIKLDRSTFTKNKAPYAGAILSYGSRLVANDSLFEGNESETEGGAVVVEYSYATFTDTTFSNNKSVKDGGAVFSPGWGVTVSGGSFTGNKAEQGNGGAIAVHNLDWVTADKVTFASNTAVKAYKMTKAEDIAFHNQRSPAQPIRMAMSMPTQR